MKTKDELLQILGSMKILMEAEKWKAARKIFDTLKVEDFPPLKGVVMSHGLLCDAETFLFYGDNDWKQSASITFTGEMMEVLQ